MANDVTVARSRESSMRQSLAALQSSQGKQTQEEVRLHELQREADATRAIYESFLAASSRSPPRRTCSRRTRI